MDHAFDFIEENNSKYLLKGSIYKNTAHEFSDIDLVLKRMDRKTVEDFINGYGEVALISRTERPLGIIIVIYQNGLCLDLDFRDKVTREEIENADVIAGSAVVVIDTLIRHHTHEHQHTFTHTHDGSTHEHTITHVHDHAHYVTDSRHGHFHTKQELEHEPGAAHAG